jgi:hypothetical protein
MVSSYLIAGFLLGGLGAIFIIYYLYTDYRKRLSDVYISKYDVDRMTKSVNPEKETGGTIDQKPSKDKAEVTLERTGKDYGGRPGIMINAEADDESVWHSHPRYGHAYVDERNEVPSPEDIAVLIKSDKEADILVTPSGKLKTYRETTKTPDKIKWYERFDPTGFILVRRLRGDMNRLEKDNPKITIKDAKSINSGWKRSLKVNYGVSLETERKTKSGVIINDVPLKEEN